MQKKEQLFQQYNNLLQLKKQQLYKLNPKHKNVEKTNIRNSLQIIHDYLAKDNLGKNDLQKIANEIASLQ